MNRSKGLTPSPFPPRTMPLEPGPGPARRTRLRSVSAGRAAEGRAVKSAAAVKRQPAKPRLCTMCREPAQAGARYCVPCIIVRGLVLERDDCCCVCCGTSVVGRHYSLGHRLRASQGGKAVPSNLITLLGLGGELHHGRIDLYRDPADAAKGYRLKSGQDPKQVAVMVFSPGGSGASAWLWDDGLYHFDGPEVNAA